MMGGIQVDTERAILREADRALKEWGRWSSDSMGSELGYPSASPFVTVRGDSIENHDMGLVEGVENAYTTWRMVTLAQEDDEVRQYHLLLQFILKIHYCEAGHVADKVHHTSRACHCQLSRSQYYVHLREARLKLGKLLCR